MTSTLRVAGVLERLSDGQIDALAAACEPLDRPDATRRARSPPARRPAAHAAIADLAAAWAADPAADRRRRRARAPRRPARRDATPTPAAPAPVWTGPGTAGDQRLTAAVLHELSPAPRERILLVSYAAYTLAELAADLEAAVERGCQVDVVFETEEDSAGAYTGPHAQPFAHDRGHPPLALARRRTAPPAPSSTPSSWSSTAGAR